MVRGRARGKNDSIKVKMLCDVDGYNFFHHSAIFFRLFVRANVLDRKRVQVRALARAPSKTEPTQRRNHIQFIITK